MLRDGHRGYERPSVVGGHLWAVVRHGEQDRPGRIIDVEVQPFGGDQLDEAFGAECSFEDHGDLGRGLLDQNEGVDPLAADEINDRESQSGHARLGSRGRGGSDGITSP